jgi:hypothetical protein
VHAKQKAAVPAAHKQGSRRVKPAPVKRLHAHRTGTSAGKPVHSPSLGSAKRPAPTPDPATSQEPQPTTTAPATTTEPTTTILTGRAHSAP